MKQKKKKKKYIIYIYILFYFQTSTKHSRAHKPTRVDILNGERGAIILARLHCSAKLGGGGS